MWNSPHGRMPSPLMSLQPRPPGNFFNGGPRGPPMRGPMRYGPPPFGRQGPPRHNNNRGGQWQGRGRGRGAIDRSLVNKSNKNMAVPKFSCDSCDRSFADASLLSTHVSQHQTCGRDGCQFTAHPKMVLAHIAAQHDTGLYLRIKEDADKWRAERKRSYPSRDNVAKREAEREEKILRGETLVDDSSRLGRESWRGRGLGRGNRRGWRGRHRGMPRQGPRRSGGGDQLSQAQVPEEDVKALLWRRNLPLFTGVELPEVDIAAVHSEDEFSDNEWQGDQPTVEAVRKLAPKCTALASLGGLYASDSDSGNEEPVTNEELRPTVSRKRLHSSSRPTDAVSLQDIGDDDKPDEIPAVVARCEPVISDDPTISGDSVKSSETAPSGASGAPVPNGEADDETGARKRQRFHKPTLPTPHCNQPRKNFQPRHLTLLEKLLSSEIQHERNVLLQCIRHTLRSNFFESDAPQ